MVKYEYKVVDIGFNPWTSKAKADYYEVLNEFGSKGWKFVQFSPGHVLTSTSTKKQGYEMIFERKIESV